MLFDILASMSSALSVAMGFPEFSHLILPGVGSYRILARLRGRGLVDPLREYLLSQGKPFLGICVGAQILSQFGHEFGMRAWAFLRVIWF